MVRYFLVFLFSFSTIYAQELNDEWLSTVLEKNISADQAETLGEETNNIYSVSYTHLRAHETDS